MKLMKRVVIIGCGSIGKRHIRNLKTLGVTEIYCLRTRKGFTQDLPTNIQVEEVYSWSDLIKKKPDIAFITNPTSLHIEAAKKIIPHIKGLFIEKPLSHNLDGVSNLLKLVEKYKVVTFMGFNIEFHPLIIEIGKLISNGDIGDVVNYQATTGQCIEKWHPYEDYHNSYAVRKDLGGGASLTLIHEINLALTWFGKVEDTYAYIRKNKKMNIDVDSNSDFMMQHINGVVSQIHMDFLQKKSIRSGTINGTDGWIKYDLINNNLLLESENNNLNKKLDDSIDYNDQSYLNMLEVFFQYYDKNIMHHEYDIWKGLDSLKIVLSGFEKSNKKV